MSIDRLGERMRTLHDIETRLGAMSAILSDAADALSSHPDGLRFTHADTPLTPLAVIRIDALMINARDWPSVDDVQRLLSDWHVAMHEARQAWRGLPETERRIVQDPGAEKPEPTRPLV